MKAPTTEDVLNSLGLTRIDNRPSQDWATAAVIFGAGLITGAAAALLVAPKSGRELRGDIASTANQLGTTVADSIPTVENMNPFNGTSRRPAQIEAK